MKPRLYKIRNYWYCEYYVLGRKFLVAGDSPESAYDKLVECMEGW